MQDWEPWLIVFDPGEKLESWLCIASPCIVFHIVVNWFAKEGVCAWEDFEPVQG